MDIEDRLTFESRTRNSPRDVTANYDDTMVSEGEIAPMELLDRLTDQAHIIETGSESYHFRRTRLCWQ